MRTIARIVLVFFVVTLLCAGGFIFMFSRMLDTESLRAQIETRLSAMTGAVCRIEGGITLSVYPWLALTLEDFVLSEPGGDEVIRVGELHAAVSVLPLLSHSIEFQRILLSGPTVILRTTANGTMPWRTMLEQVRHTEENAISEQVDPGGFSLESLSLTGVSVVNGVLKWREESGTARAGESENITLSRINVDVDIDDTARWDGSFILEGTVVPFNVAVSANGGTTFEKDSYIPAVVSGALKAKGSMTVEGHHLPVNLDTAFHFTPAQQELELPTLTADLDGLGVNGSFAFANCTSENWMLTGGTELKDLSLPFWFGFGERLPPSLQHALDSLHGKLTLRMNRRGVWADSLSVDILGMQFDGMASVADFSKPTVYVDVAGANINVNKVFPEIMETPPAVLPQPKRPGKPVFSADMEPDDNPADDIGYDIRVRAQNATARSFGFEGLAFRCWPMPKTGTYTSYTIDSFYGGKVDALLSIRETLGLDVNVKNVRTQEVSKLIVGEPILGGTLSGKASVQARAKTVWGMVAGLEGKVEATLNDGYIQTIAKRDGSKPKHAIDSFSLTLKGKSQHANPDKAERYLPYMWDMQMGFTPAGSTDRYDIQLQGPVIVDSRRALPVRTTNAHASLRWQGKNSLFGKVVPMDLAVTGSMNFDLEKETVSFLDATAVTPDIRTKCSFTGRELLGKPIWDGTVDTDDINLRTCLTHYGIEPWQTADPRALSWAKGKAKFHADSTDVSFRDVELLVDGTRLVGGVAFQPGSPLVTRYSVKVDSVDLDRYLPPPVNGTAEPAEPWDFGWLKKNDMAGELFVGKAVYRNLDFSSLAVRTSASKGTLIIEPLTAGFYKGTISGKLVGSVKEAVSVNAKSAKAPGSGALDTQLELNLKDVDLESPASRFFGNDYIGGKTALFMNLKGLLRSNDDIPRELGGTWGFAIRDGYYSIGTKTDGTRSRTGFDRASANGTMAKGVLKNDNLKMHSLLVGMTGGGLVDLAKKSVDYQVNVTYAEIPTFPVRIYGSLNAPQTSINGVEAIPRTIEKLGGGLFNIFRRIIATPFQALEMLGRMANNSTKAQ